MKKTGLLLLLTFISLNLFPQIQRKFYDFHMGETTKNEVISYFRVIGKEFQFEENNTMRVSDMKFGGEEWPTVFFNFYNNRLYSISFINSELKTSKNSLKTIYDRLKRKLDEKYSNYYNTQSVEYFLGYTDDKTDVCLRYAKFEGVYMLIIMYSDIELMLKEDDDGKDEL